MAKETLLYAQSGGVTAVINATAAAVITEARSHRIKVLAARNGILGALREDLIDTSKESITAIRALTHTPGGAFGSCRFKLKSLEADHEKYERLLEVFKAHNVRWFLYNGGNDSADTALKVSQLAKTFDYPLHCIGVPKTHRQRFGDHRRQLPASVQPRQLHCCLHMRSHRAGCSQRRPRPHAQGFHLRSNGPPCRLARCGCWQ